MIGTLKGLIKSAAAAVPGARTLLMRYKYRNLPLDEKQLRGAIQLVAHSIDLKMGAGQAAPLLAIRELEYLLTRFARAGHNADAPIAWAVTILDFARLGLRSKAETPPVRAAGEESLARMPLLKALLERRSVRAWTADPVNADDITRCIDLARWAPSSCNRQLWQTILISDPKEKEFLNGYFPNRFYMKAPLAILVLVNSGPYGTDEKQNVYLDAGAFIQNLLLALHAMGYGACWIGFRGWDSWGNVIAPRERYEAFYQHYGLAKHVVPVSLVAVGRPAVVPQAPPRQDLKSVIIRNV